MILSSGPAVDGLKRALDAKRVFAITPGTTRHVQLVHNRAGPSRGCEIETQILRLDGLGADDADETIVVLLRALSEATEDACQIRRVRPHVDDAGYEGAGEQG